MMIPARCLRELPKRWGGMTTEDWTQQKKRFVAHFINLQAGTPKTAVFFLLPKSFN